MTPHTRRLVATITLIAFAHVGCYNTYFISKDELEKLESGVEVKEVVTVSADCPQSGSASTDSLDDKRKLAEMDKAKKSGESETASDAAPPAKADGDKKKADGKKASGCTEVPVSTANAINVVDEKGAHHRVTPFNFMMSEQQIVSPEYDLLLSLENVEGAEVREFSTWKTVGTIAGVSTATIGMFVGLSLFSEEQDFSD